MKTKNIQLLFGTVFLCVGAFILTPQKATANIIDPVTTYRWKQYPCENGTGVYESCTEIGDGEKCRTPGKVTRVC